MSDKETKLEEHLGQAVEVSEETDVGVQPVGIKGTHEGAMPSMARILAVNRLLQTWVLISPDGRMWGNIETSALLGVVTELLSETEEEREKWKQLAQEASNKLALMHATAGGNA